MTRLFLLAGVFMLCTWVRAESWRGISLSPEKLCEDVLDEASYTTTRLREAFTLSEGREQWLFRSRVDYQEDFSLDPHIYSGLARLSRAFANNGIEFLLVSPASRGLVSSRMLNLDDSFAEAFSTEVAEQSYKARLERLGQLGVKVVDFSSLHHWTNSEKPLFFKRDVHWTAEGAFQSARITAETIKKLPVYHDMDEVQFSIMDAGLNIYKKGSLKRAVKAICGQNRPDEYARIYKTEKSDMNSLSLFDYDPQIILLGTSFSANKSFNYTGSLQYFLKRDILNLSISGGTYSGAMERYLHDDYLLEDKPKLIVWESPLNDIPKSSDFFRRVIPPIYGGCSVDEQIIEHNKLLSDGINPVLVNKKPLDQIFKSDEYFLKFEFDNRLINRFEVKIWYANGKSEKVKIDRSHPIESNGLFFLELNSEPPFNGQGFVAADLLLKKELPHSGKVKTSLCKRKDLNKSVYTVGVKNG